MAIKLTINSSEIEISNAKTDISDPLSSVLDNEVLPNNHWNIDFVFSQKNKDEFISLLNVYADRILRKYYS